MTELDDRERPRIVLIKFLCTQGRCLMIHQIKICFFLVFAFLSFYSAAQSSQSADSEALANEVIQQSGLSVMISQFPVLLKEGIQQGGEQSGEEGSGNNQKMIMQISQIIDQAFVVSESIEGISAELSTELTEQELLSVLEWLNSPLGKKITQMEIDIMSSEAYKDMQSQLLSLQEKYRGSERERLFERFDKATNATEASLETAIAVQLTLASAMSASSNNPQMPSYEELKQSIESNRFMMRGVIGQQVFANYLYTYQKLTDDELEAYINFVSTPAGNHYSLVVNEAVKNALLKPSEVIGSKIMAEAISG